MRLILSSVVNILITFSLRFFACRNITYIWSAWLLHFSWVSKSAPVFLMWAFSEGLSVWVWVPEIPARSCRTVGQLPTSCGMAEKMPCSGVLGRFWPVSPRNVVLFSHPLAPLPWSYCRHESQPCCLLDVELGASHLHSLVLVSSHLKWR